MRSSERTYMSRLGYRDPDKSNPRHDLAIQYLSQGHVARKLYKALVQDVLDIEVIAAEPEFHLMKGEGKYRTTISYLDLALEVVVYHKASVRYPTHCLAKQPYHRRNIYFLTEEQKREVAEWEKKKDRRSRAIDHVSKMTIEAGVPRWLYIEVKIGEEPIGDILRQMRTYHEYSRDLCPRYYNTGNLSVRSLGQWEEVVNADHKSCNEESCELVDWLGGAHEFGRSILNEVAASLGNRVQKHPRAILVTDYGMDEDNIKTLAKIGVAHAQLGPDFDKYIENRKKRNKPVNRVQI